MPERPYDHFYIRNFPSGALTRDGLRKQGAEMGIPWPAINFAVRELVRTRGDKPDEALLQELSDMFDQAA